MLAEFILIRADMTRPSSPATRRLSILEESVGRDSDITAMALNCQVRLYVLEGKYDQAYELGCEVLTSLETALLPSHPSIIAVKQNGRYDQEVKTVAQVVKMDETRGHSGK